MSQRRALQRQRPKSLNHGGRGGHGGAPRWAEILAPGAVLRALRVLRGSVLSSPLRLPVLSSVTSVSSVVRFKAFQVAPPRCGRGSRRDAHFHARFYDAERLARSTRATPDLHLRERRPIV